MGRIVQQAHLVSLTKFNNTIVTHPTGDIASHLSDFYLGRLVTDVRNYYIASDSKEKELLRQLLLHQNVPTEPYQNFTFA